MTDPIKLTLVHLESAVRQIDGFAKGRALHAAAMKDALAPSEAVLRTEYDLLLIDKLPARGRAAEIARRIRFNPVIRAYRNGLNLPDTMPALTQWVARRLDRIIK